MTAYLGISKIPHLKSRDRNYSFGDKEICDTINAWQDRGSVTSNLKNRHHKFHLILKTEDPGILGYRLGEKKYSWLKNSYLHLAKKELSIYNARRIKWEEDLVLAAFVSAQQAISCLMAVSNSMKNITDQNSLKMVLKLRAPVENKEEDFRADPFFFYKMGTKKPVIEQKVIELAPDKPLQLLQSREDMNIIELEEQRYLTSLFKIIKENWQNPFFNVEELCSKMSSSQSRLYRRCKKITGISPIRLIKEYRLLCCLKSLRSPKSITGILYDSGFNSPSYFSRCFKNRFGMSPYFYQKNLVKNLINT